MQNAAKIYEFLLQDESINRYKFEEKFSPFSLSISMKFILYLHILQANVHTHTYAVFGKMSMA